MKLFRNILIISAVFFIGGVVVGRYSGITSEQLARKAIELRSFAYDCYVAYKDSGKETHYVTDYEI